MKLNWKTTAVTGTVSAVLAVVYISIQSYMSLGLRVINGLSIVAIGNILLAVGINIRNTGQFRLLGYGRYMKQKKELSDGAEKGNVPSDQKIPTFNEYSDEKYKNRWDALPFYAVGLTLLVVSIALIFLLDYES